MIKAVKNGIERNFSEKQWQRMPRGKFGWSQVLVAAAPQNVVPDEIVQKKILGASAADVSNVPEEIKVRQPAPILQPEPIFEVKPEPPENINTEDDKAVVTEKKELVKSPVKKSRKRVVKKSK